MSLSAVATPDHAPAARPPRQSTPRAELLARIDSQSTAGMTDDQKLGLQKLREVAEGQLREDDPGNAAFFGKLVSQIVAGARGLATLTARIGDVNGLPAFMAQIYKIPIEMGEIAAPTTGRNGAKSNPPSSRR